MLRKIISKLLAFEGVLHFVIPLVSFYGMYKENVWDWMIALTPIVDIVFGIVCLIGSRLLGQDHMS